MNRQGTPLNAKHKDIEIKNEKQSMIVEWATTFCLMFAFCCCVVSVRLNPGATLPLYTPSHSSSFARQATPFGQ